MKNEYSLQVLVCSANLGNACPDDESLHQWIPDNGKCVEVIGTTCNSQLNYMNKMNLSDQFETSSNNLPTKLTSYDEEDEDNDDDDEVETNKDKTPHTLDNTNTTGGTKYPIRKRTDLPPTYNSNPNLTDSSISHLQYKNDVDESSVKNSSNVLKNNLKNYTAASTSISSIMTNHSFDNFQTTHSVYDRTSNQSPTMTKQTSINDQRNSTSNTSIKYTDSDQFDIIVIGMQEATFLPPEKESVGTKRQMSKLEKVVEGSEKNNDTDEKAANSVVDGSKHLSDTSQQSFKSRDDGHNLDNSDSDNILSTTSLLPTTKSNGGLTSFSSESSSSSKLKGLGSMGISSGRNLGKVLMKIPKYPIQQIHEMKKLTGPSLDHTRKQSNRLFVIQDENDAKDSIEVVPVPHLTDDNATIPTGEGSVTSYGGGRETTVFCGLPSTTSTKLNSALLLPVNALKMASHELLHSTEWLDGTPVLHRKLDARLPGYNRIVSYQRGEMRLEIYVHQRQVDVQVLHVAAQNTGRGGLANKGGIVAEVLVNSRTKLSFITTHLEAHEGKAKYQVRCSTIADILDGTKVNRHLPDVSCTSHYSFFMGDLNFRSELPESDGLSDSNHKRQVMTMISNEDWEMLNSIDELGRAIRTNACLAGYQTLFCNFPPTFKVERDSGYKYNEKRRPSYTDRILWKPGHQLENKIRPLVYEPIDNFTSSDHKPIRCAFTVEMNEPFELRPQLVRSRTNLFASTRSIISSSTRSILPSGRGGRRSDRNDDGANARVLLNSLNMFISELQCNISWENKLISNSLPDPYICFASDPEELITVKKSKRKWVKLQKKISTVLHLESRRSKVTNDSCWPCTSTKKQTFNPDWDDEEIKLEIRTHRKDGVPIDMSGALLYICVMNRRSDGDVLLGTFSFNLIDMIRKCRQTSMSNREFGKLKGNKSEGASRNSGGGSQNIDGGRSSWKLRRSIDRIEHKDESVTDDDTIYGVDVNESLVLNGVVTGRIQCRIEGWWMDDKTMRILKDIGGIGAFSTDDINKKSTNNNKSKTDTLTNNSVVNPLDGPKVPIDEKNGKFLNGTYFDKTADGRQIMLQSRPVQKSQHQ